MKKFNWKIILLFILVSVAIPIVITWAYSSDKPDILIHTQIPAGNLTQYCGAIVSAAIAIYALFNTIKENKKKFERDLKISLQKTHMDKLYFDVCDMSTKIMINLGLKNTFPEIQKINNSSDDDKMKIEKIQSIFYETIKELNELNKQQWYYYLRLENEGYFDNKNNNDVETVKDYFDYIYKLMNTDKDDNKGNCLVARFYKYLEKAKNEKDDNGKVKIYREFIRSLDYEYHGGKDEAHQETYKYNQYRIKEETQKMTKSLKEIIYLELTNDKNAINSH